MKPEEMKSHRIYITSSDDPINPNHYITEKMQVFDVIDAFDLDLYTGTAVKYLCRAGKKDPSKEVEDLKKSIRYIERKIENLEKIK